MIKYDGGCVDYDEYGDGPTVVLVPGSCSTGAAWRPVITQLKGKYRCVTTSLLGYGGTTERRTDLNSDMSHEAEIVEKVVRRAGGDVHLVGHSFGGLVALAVALRNRVCLRGLTIIEAPAPALLRQTGEQAHYRAFREMTDRYFAAFHAGRRNAIETMIDFYGGTGTFAAWPAQVRHHAIETTRVNIRDWTTAYEFRPNLTAMADIDVPTLVVWGQESHPAVRRANEILSHCITRTSVVTMPNTAHFMIMTHAREVAQIVSKHVRLAESRVAQMA